MHEDATWQAAWRQSFRQDRRWLSVFVALYAGAALIILARRPYFLTLDAVAYLGVAEQVARGEFRSLVNAHWSPVWPALLAAWFSVFPAGVPSAHAAAVLLSLVLLMELYGVLAASVADRRVRAFWLVAVAPVVFSGAVLLLTPDLLQASLVLPLTAVLYLAHKKSSRRLALLAGALATVFYLVKCFGFPWALCLALVTAAYRYWVEGVRRRVVSITAMYLLVFSLGSFFWMAALRAEYGRWTICLAEKILVPGSGYLYLDTGRGLEWMGVLVEPPAGRRHLWDDPARRTHQETVEWDWARLQRALFQNARDVAKIVLHNAALALAFLCLWGLRPGAGGLHSLCAWLAGSWIFGYMLAYVQYRYVLPGMILLFVAAFAGAERLRANGRAWRVMLAASGVMLVAAGGVSTARELWGHSQAADYDRMLMAAAAAIRADAAPGTIAADALEESLMLAYHAGRASVNVLTPHPRAVIDEAAQRFNIRYLLWKRPSQKEQRELQDWTRLWTGHGAPGFWVLFKRLDRAPEAPESRTP